MSEENIQKTTQQPEEQEIDLIELAPPAAVLSSVYFLRS